jgi:hypothetical protein
MEFINDIEKIDKGYYIIKDENPDYFEVVEVNVIKDYYSDEKILQQAKTIFEMNPKDETMENHYWLINDKIVSKYKETHTNFDNNTYAWYKIDPKDYPEYLI